MNTVDAFNSIELECVEYVAGYVASRYYEKYPQLISTKEEHTMCWTNFLSRGCLKIPSKMLLDGMKLLETCFIKQHGNNVSKIPGVMRTITDIMKKQLTDYKLEIPEEVCHVQLPYSMH
ncbi:piggyBac transposable element-derived protein 4-like [Aphis craccivora]|uniref:PiggyBac transposable element-derived protein 4-like n=1 Tax=Aphis craccivora TaxID=307492 RepID=A0A6G0VM43_APHCR|nr:piggyBac transposable element-derived protein 4-like [Aphis craccivora]